MVKFSTIEPLRAMHENGQARRFPNYPALLTGKDHSSHKERQAETNHSRQVCEPEPSNLDDSIDPCGRSVDVDVSICRSNMIRHGCRDVRQRQGQVPSVIVPQCCHDGGVRPGSGAINDVRAIVVVYSHLLFVDHGAQHVDSHDVVVLVDLERIVWPDIFSRLRTSSVFPNQSLQRSF
jgi:hypothetical protein